MRLRCEARPPKWTRAAFAAAVLSLLAPFSAAAQQGTAAPQEPPGGDVSARLDAMQKKLDAQAAALAALEEEKKATDEKVAALEGQVSGLAAADADAAFAEAGTGEYETDKLLDVYGFFDFKFLKGLWKDDSPYAFYLPSDATFMMTNVNLYFASHMTESLDALIELRLSFLPIGQVRETETVIVTPNGTMSTGQYLREETSSVDPGTTMQFEQGGLTLERVHLTWAPVDWFKATAGRFLTPYGIWNVDHGSPVILAVTTPYMQLRRMMPSAQTGLMFAGRFFPRYDLFFEYAVTLSNGRGPMDEVMDLDENKAVGVKLKLSYEGEKITAALGSYGYVGRYSDVERHAVLYLDEEMRVDDSVKRPFLAERVDKANAMEYAVSADALLELYGVRLQSELMWTRTDYDTVPIREADFALFKGAPAGTPLFYASNIGIGYYVLAAWELPLEKWIRPVRITPYVMWEDTKYDDTQPMFNFRTVTGGLNVKPSPFVTLKVEYMHGFPATDMWGDPLRIVEAQLAVSF
jgi:hypothetical protein